MFDNLGEEKQSEWVRDDVIGSVIDYRNKNNLLTFITSSFTLEEIEKGLGEQRAFTEKTVGKRCYFGLW